MPTALHWFRNDLRLHDQPAIATLPADHSFLGVFLLEPRKLNMLQLGWPRMSGHRLRFLRQSLTSLKRALQARGSDLLILAGDPAALLPELVHQGSVARLSWQNEHTREELDTEKAIRRALAGNRTLDIQTWEGLSLLHPDDLPFGPPHFDGLPDVFTAFRKAVEPRIRVREPLRDPVQVLFAGQGSFPNYEQPLFGPKEHFARAWTRGWQAQTLDPARDEDWPQPAHPLWRKEASPDARTAFPFSGGETSGLERLSDYVRSDGALRTYKETRNGLLGADYSSKLSAWLANGCLSPRQVYQAVKQHETTYGANNSTYWLIFELLWRDFFRFQAIKQGDQLFAFGGPQQRRWARQSELTQRRELQQQSSGPPHKNRPRHWSLSSQKQATLERWTGGTTGQPFIDANMRELAATGWMSNRGRQNVASYLVHDLGLDWRMGAWWFESLLLDYDVASNWGNWQYAAGVGLDPRSPGSGQRRFNPEKQAAQYDPDGAYVRLWLV